MGPEGTVMYLRTNIHKDNNMNDLSKRLLASVRMDAVNGDGYERSICAKQMTEAAAALDEKDREIKRLQSIIDRHLMPSDDQDSSTA